MSSRSPSSATRVRGSWLPWLVLGVLGALTLVTWWVVSAEIERTARARYDRLVDRLTNNLRLRFTTAAHLLHGAAALHAASDEVTAAEWSVYLRRAATQLDSGVVGLGYAHKIRREDIDALEAKVRGEGFPDFKAERVGNNEYMYVVTSIEPRELNNGVVGLDVGSGHNRKGAAEAAAAENTMVLSRRLTLKYEPGDVPGFLLFLPVYHKGATLDTPEHRLAAVEGWVYAPIRIDQLMAGVSESVAGQIDFMVYEGDDTLPDKLLFDADNHVAVKPGVVVARDELAHRLFRSVQSMDIFGKRWTLQLSTLPEFERSMASVHPAFVLIGGLLLSGLGALLTWSLVNSRQRATELAADMTRDLRKAEEDARRLALVASRTASGVLLADADWRIEWINEGYTRIFGYTLEEIRGRRPVDFMTGRDTSPATLEEMKRAADAGRPFVGEILNYTRDGRPIWIELEIQVLRNAQGERTGYMGMQVDVTETKKQAQQLREAKEAAEHANEAKSQFLATMSHEIRTPMNGVIGMASLLLDTPLTPEQRESAETIRQSGDALLRIINDILDFSKIESGRLDMELTEFGLRDAVESALDVLAMTAAKKNLELLCELAEGTPAVVRGDVVRLRQILVNFIGNAVKFTAQGEVVVSVRPVRRTAGEVELHFAVRDTGIGISAANLQRLFQPFTQVDASTTRRYGGTGLGLAICRRLVELMGGRVSVESEEGRGSTFSFFLPLQEVPAPESRPPTPAALAGTTVVIVEDNVAAARIYSDLVRRAGSEAVVAPSIVGALERLRSDSPADAVVIDRRFSDQAAVALARQIRELPARRDTPLILLSPAGRRESGEGVFAAILTKPVKASQLYDALIGALAKGK